MATPNRSCRGPLSESRDYSVISKHYLFTSRGLRIELLMKNEVSLERSLKHGQSSELLRVMALFHIYLKDCHQNSHSARSHFRMLSRICSQSREQQGSRLISQTAIQRAKIETTIKRLGERGCWSLSHSRSFQCRNNTRMSEGWPSSQAAKQFVKIYTCIPTCSADPRTSALPGCLYVAIRRSCG